jgi:hypothetical protein
MCLAYPFVVVIDYFTQSFTILVWSPMVEARVEANRGFIRGGFLLYQTVLCDN